MMMYSFLTEPCTSHLEANLLCETSEFQDLRVCATCGWFVTPTPPHSPSKEEERLQCTDETMDTVMRQFWLENYVPALAKKPKICVVLVDKYGLGDENVRPVE